jgi:hypothetical protein
MQRYVISAVLPVRSVTIQDLEHIDRSYQLSKFVRLVFYSVRGRVILWNIQKITRSETKTLIGHLSQHKLWTKTIQWVAFPARKTTEILWSIFSDPSLAYNVKNALYLHHICSLLTNFRPNCPSSCNCALLHYTIFFLIWSWIFSLMNHVKNKFRPTIQVEKVKLWVTWIAKMKELNPTKVVFWNKSTA